jgi:hypothetical protein
MSPVVGVMNRWIGRTWVVFLSLAVFSSAIADDELPVCKTGAQGQMGSRMHDGAHMTMTALRAMSRDDEARANRILKTMRESLAKYQDYKVALAEGYEIYMPDAPQQVYHFASRSLTIGEYQGDYDLAHPGSLLYEKKFFGGWKLVGAMYSASPRATQSQLDELIPLGVARWHAHTNICLPQGVTERDVINGDLKNGPQLAAAARTERPGDDGGPRSGDRQRLGWMADPRFGFEGTISDESACEAIGGNFHKQIFGWMVHVYPFTSEDLRVAFSTNAP